MVSLANVALVLGLLLLNNIVILLVMRSNKANNKPTAVSDLAIHVDAVEDQLNLKINKAKSNIANAIAEVDEKVTQLAESTTQAFENFKAQ